MGAVLAQTFIRKMVQGKELDEKAVNEAIDGLKKRFSFLEETFFKTSPNYLVTDKLSYADIQLGAVCVVFTRLGGVFPQFKFSLDEHPKITAFFENLGKTEHGKKIIEKYDGALKAMAAAQAKK